MVTSLQFIAGSFYIPKDNSKPSGQDAHLICPEEQVLALADGVGGWAKHGIDSGEYARELISNLEIAIQSGNNHGDLERVLLDAYSNTKAKGASTACIIKLTDRVLNCLNVGDSGFIVVQEGAVIYRSPIQQSYFNCQFQLGNSPSCNRPNSAQSMKVMVQPGDIIVAGTDGLFDNLFKHEIAGYIVSGVKDGMDPEILAWTLAERALYKSQDIHCATPYMLDGEAVGHYHEGGKKDDITVIVAYVI
ncbi:hypothetical protein GIB67_003284 [Kingdonia uniflora]|uniref:Protein phosphatase n=1 Tax=Kingdonia uniflora TaxID=39325 RepID=A0A7J7LXK4_9MAGN|nr:hypothetical protein GIB67_003284 [Kingdonia uniflora]